MPTAFTTRALALLALFGSLVAPLASAELTAAEERGRAIYFGERGSALEDATVHIGELETKLPARTFPCASCHGRTGLGKSERGVQPSQITRDALTRPYSVREASGRKRPPYTATTFRNAVRGGKDAGGNALAEAMPRFSLTDKQLADVWAFLAVIAEATDPGISDNAVTIGVVLDAAHPASTAQQKLLNVLAGDINKIGGVHGRKLVFRTVAPARAGTEAGDVFALLAPQGAPPSGVAPGVPVISVFPAATPSSSTFALVASEADQVAALKRFAAEEWGVVRVKDACAAKPGDTVLIASVQCLDTARTAKRALMTQAVFASIPPASRKTLPAETQVAIAAPLSRVARNAQSAFAQTRSRTGNDKSAILAEADAYSAAALVIEALMRTGRDVSREGVIETLEAVRGFEGGLTPPLTFGPNRHVGSRGAEMVRYDPKTGTLAASGTWIDADLR
ncbi:MAG: hypothetical protein Q8L84_00645 [Hyphomonas sp.]|nr:hypothetical protein [Hyphomonas sp.]